MGSGPGREQRKRPCRQVGVSPTVISALASCQPQLLSPSPWAEAVCLWYEEAEEGAPLPVLGNPSSQVLKLKQGTGRSFGLFLEAGGLEPVEERLRKKRETDSRGWRIIIA